MTSMAISQNSITVTKGIHVDHYDYFKHFVFKIPLGTKSLENDTISDLIISKNCKYLALITSVSKQMLVYDLPLTEKYKRYELPRSASKIRFTANDDQILVADKSGDVLLYNLTEEDTGTKLLGHLSLLLDVLQTKDSKYIITSDRDEKIRVSCYPKTYITETYCLGHKEFVNHIELLPHDQTVLTSTSGDGHIKFWNYINGTLLYSIYTYLDVNDDQLREEFTKAMDIEGVEVNTLPIVHYTVEKLDNENSILAVAVHTFNKILLYNLQTTNNKFNHKLVDKILVNRFPTSIKLHGSSLFVYDDVDCNVNIYKNFLEKGDNNISVFENNAIEDIMKSQDLIKVLYKRRFDNVQEYQERKRQRLEKITH